MMAPHKTIFGEEVDVIAETDALYTQLIGILHRDERFAEALHGGALTEDGKAAIADAFAEVIERNLKLARIFLADDEARKAFTGFWFARCYAEVQANKSYNDAFRRANILPA